jgi:hypothetical protein
MLKSVRKLARIDPLGEFVQTLTAVLVASLIVNGLLPSGTDLIVLSAAYRDTWAVVYLGLT